eukprot:111172_1
MDTRNIGKVTCIQFEKCFHRFAMKNIVKAFSELSATEINRVKQQDDPWRQGLKQRFELIDTDNDGFISLDDFIQFTKKKNPNSSDKQIKKIFYRMDTRNIGKVTWSQFEKCFRRFAMKNMALKRVQAAGNIIENDDIKQFDERE